MLRRSSWIVLFLVLAAGCSQKPAEIVVTPKPVKIYGIERAQRLTGRVLDKKGRPLETAAPTWTSSKPAVVTVDSAGRLVAKGEGRALVTAAYLTISTQVSVEVVDIKEIVVSPPQARLVGALGTQIPLTATVKNSKNKGIPMKVTWSSSHPAIAAVSTEGIVTTAGPGTAEIIAKIADVQGASEIEVLVQEIARLEIRPATALVRVGDSQHFTIVAFTPDGKAIEGAAATFRSSDPAVATVDGAGIASGKAAGTATIHATVAGATVEATLLVN